MDCNYGKSDIRIPVSADIYARKFTGGDLVDDCPVFEVHLSGINVTDVKKMLKVVPSIPTINKDLSELQLYHDKRRSHRLISD